MFELEHAMRLDYHKRSFKVWNEMSPTNSIDINEN